MTFLLVTSFPVLESPQNVYTLKKFGYTFEDSPIHILPVRSESRRIMKFASYEDAKRLKKFEANSRVIMEDDFIDIITYDELVKLEAAAAIYE